MGVIPMERVQTLPFHHPQYWPRANWGLIPSLALVKHRCKYKTSFFILKKTFWDKINLSQNFYEESIPYRSNIFYVRPLWNKIPFDFRSIFLLNVSCPLNIPRLHSKPHRSYNTKHFNYASDNFQLWVIFQAIKSFRKKWTNLT